MTIRLLLQQREQPVADVIAGVRDIRVGLVLTPGQMASREVHNDLRVGGTQERAGEPEIRDSPCRPDARQTTKAGPAPEPMEDRLRVVALLVACADPHSAPAPRHRAESGQAQLPPGGLQR